MAWIASHQSLGKHPKLLRLAARLRITAPQAIGHLHYLWWWTLEYAPDGDLSKFQPDEIAIASEWTGDPAHWIDALRSGGWIDPDGHLHDWDEHGGKLASERAKERDRKRAERAKAKAEVRSPPEVPCPTPVQGTSAGHPVLHNTTLEKPREIRVEREKGVPAVMDEVPVGFPKTAAEAARVAPESTPPGFAEKLWHLAASRGWRDARNIRIQSWSSYLAASVTFAREAESRRRTPVPSQAGNSKRVSMDAGMLQEVLHAPVLKF